MIAQRKAGARGGELRITFPDGSTKTIPLDQLHTLETRDPYVERALRAQIAAEEFTEPVTRPARIDSDIDAIPAVPRETKEDSRALLPRNR